MTSRMMLPNRREHFVFEFNSDGIAYTAGAGFFRDGALAELFLTSRKPGSAAGTAARDGAVVVSIALQHAVPASVLSHALTRLPDGSAAGPLARALDLISAGAHVAPLEARA